MSLSLNIPHFTLPGLLLITYWYYMALQSFKTNRQQVLAAGIALLVWIIPGRYFSVIGWVMWTLLIFFSWLAFTHWSLMRAPMSLKRFFVMVFILGFTGYVVAQLGYSTHPLLSIPRNLQTYLNRYTSFGWQLIVYGMGFAWSVWGGTLFVRTVLDPFATSAMPVNEEELRRGRMIGNLERLLLAILALMNIWSLASVAIAVKAIARFKKLEEKEFAEYFLIGTLASLLWAIVTIIVVKWMLQG